jgi:menaquinone-specific isochorismate synthase
MLAPIALLEQLKGRLQEMMAAVPLFKTEGLVSFIVPLSYCPTVAPQWSGVQFQFIKTHERSLYAGYGVAAEWMSSGKQRLHEFAKIAQHWQRHWIRYDPDTTGFDVQIMLGFAANADEPASSQSEYLPNALLWIPDVALQTVNGQAALIFSTTCPASPQHVFARWATMLDQLVPLCYQPVSTLQPTTTLIHDRAQPDVMHWSALVTQALQAIDANEFDKVVLSRRLDVRARNRFDVSRLLGALGHLFPSCELINIHRTAKNFVAATPERLLQLRDKQLEVDAIAGTSARAPSASHDHALTAALRDSDKNLREHRFVVDAVRHTLAPYCLDIQNPSQPQIMQLSNAQHLWSPIRARIVKDVDIFKLADCLHPTPATNGQPRDQARDWLHQHEPFKRGWYTGVAGLITPELDGELWVLLRCALIHEDGARLYAGSGLVAGSDPQSEWDETQAKLGAMLTALQFA